jgi:hypothetical protein
VSEIEDWNKIFERNCNILKERYALPDGWFYGDDIKAYRMLAEQVPNGGTICELGVWRGRSLCSIADIIRKKKLNVIAVDTFHGTLNEGDMHEFAIHNDMQADFENNLKRFGISAKIYATTTNEASELVKDKIDLLFIDADHSYETVKEDIERWCSKVRCFIAGHDFNTWDGVTKAVLERYKDVKSLGSVWYKDLRV